MTQTSADTEQFTGLILLTGTDRPGIAASLFETLAPFSVLIIDIEQIVINDRLILTVLIGANPAHQGAIEEDLNLCASSLDMDIATLFGKGTLASLPKNLVEVRVTSPKLRPGSLALISQAITHAGANIVRINRTSDDPISISLAVTGAAHTALKISLESIIFEDGSVIDVKEI